MTGYGIREFSKISLKSPSSLRLFFNFGNVTPIHSKIIEDKSFNLSMCSLFLMREKGCVHELREIKTERENVPYLRIRHFKNRFRGSQSSFMTMLIIIIILLLLLGWRGRWKFTHSSYYRGNIDMIIHFVRETVNPFRFSRTPAECV